MGVCGAVKAARRTEEENMAFPELEKEYGLRWWRIKEWRVRRFYLASAKQGPAATLKWSKPRQRKHVIRPILIYLGSMTFISKILITA